MRFNLHIHLLMYFIVALLVDDTRTHSTMVSWSHLDYEYMLRNRNSNPQSHPFSDFFQCAIYCVVMRSHKTEDQRLWIVCDIFCRPFLCKWRSCRAIAAAEKEAPKSTIYSFSVINKSNLSINIQISLVAKWRDDIVQMEFSEWHAS